MSRAKLSYERPSRLSRVVVLVSALAVGFLAVWVLTPILLARLAATSAAVPQPREVASAPRDVASIPRRAMSAPRQASDLGTPSELAAPAQPVRAEMPAPPATAAAAEPPPVPAVEAVSPSALSISADVTPAPPAASSIPWPVSPADVEPANVEPAKLEPAASTGALPSPPSEQFSPVPLPRKRPNLMVTAQLADIPLPRPRPDAAPSAAPPAPDRGGENGLFDRMGYE